MNNRPYILITGTTSGIGKELAIKFSKCYNVILHGRNSEKLEEVSSKCSSDSFVLIWQHDLTDLENLEDSLKSFLSGNEIVISYFVHCAGFMKMLPLKMVNISTLQTTFSTNVFSASLITKVITLKKINKGALKSIVFISSNISDRGAKAFSVYGASKGALDSMMRCLATELAPAIRVNSVLPGAVQTEMTGEIFSDEALMARMNATYPLGLGFPDDIYKATSFLISEEARWITGQQLTVDGGRTINITG